MAKNPPQELRDFHHFVGAYVDHGGATPSPEEILDEWRQQHPVPEDDADELAGIQESIDDLERGDRGVPFAEFDREFRERHHRPDRT